MFDAVPNPVAFTAPVGLGLLIRLNSIQSSATDRSTTTGQKLGVKASVPVTHSTATAARDESEKDAVQCLSLSRDPGILHDEHRHYRETRLARRI